MKFGSYILSTFLVSLTLAGCIPQTQMIQDGHEWIQLTQTYNFWGANVVKETHCRQTELKDGFCWKAGHQASTIVEAPGVRLTGAALSSAAMVSSAGLLMHGLKNQPVSQPAQMQVFPNSHVSTLNSNAYTTFVPKY